jgi:hypothetical protein
VNSLNILMMADATRCAVAGVSGALRAGSPIHPGSPRRTPFRGGTQNRRLPKYPEFTLRLSGEAEANGRIEQAIRESASKLMPGLEWKSARGGEVLRVSCD